jgi:hypothetical protein
LVPSHDDVALANVQALPQRPQLVDVSRGVSQPAWLVQSPNPALHAPITHCPLTQEASALRKLQTIPQAPQLFLSVLVSTHLFPHFVGAVVAQSDTQVC